MKPSRYLDSIPIFFSIFYLILMLSSIMARVRFDYGALLVALLLACSLGLVFKRRWAVRGGSWLGLVGGVLGMYVFFRSGMAWNGILLVFILFSFMLSALLNFSLMSKYYDGSSGGSKVFSILIVDDDRGLLRMLGKNLMKDGFLTSLAETGEKGLQFARRDHPDLILLDVILPGIKGRNVCAQLKANAQTRDIPVIFLTAKNSPDDIQAEMAAGAVAHITKPVDYRHLLGEIKKYLPR